MPLPWPQLRPRVRRLLPRWPQRLPQRLWIDPLNLPRCRCPLLCMPPHLANRWRGAAPIELKPLEEPPPPRQQIPLKRLLKSRLPYPGWPLTLNGRLPMSCRSGTGPFPSSPRQQLKTGPAISPPRPYPVLMCRLPTPGCPGITGRPFWPEPSRWPLPELNSLISRLPPCPSLSPSHQLRYNPPTQTEFRVPLGLAPGGFQPLPET